MIVPLRPPGPFWHDGSDIVGTPEELAALRASSDATAARIRAYVAMSAPNKRAALTTPPASPPPPPVAVVPVPPADPDDAAPPTLATIRFAADLAPSLPWPVGPEMGLMVVWMDACRRHHEAKVRGDAHAAVVAANERAAARNRLEGFGSDLSTALLIMLRYTRRFDPDAARELMAELLGLPALAAEVADIRRDVDALAGALQLQESSSYLPAAPAEVCP